MHSRFWIYLTIIIVLLVIIIYIHTAINRKLSLSLEPFRSTELPFTLNIENLFIEDPNIWSGKLATYWLFMNQPNVEARGQSKLSDLQNEYRCDGIQPICKKEKNDIVSAIMLNVKSIKDIKPEIYHYLKYWCQRFKLAKGATWLEGGMPHTHEDVIILPAKYFTPSGFSFSTFLHEVTHIHQRKYPQDWDELIWQWGFLHYNFLDAPASGLENILVRNRTNPDGLDINYLWRDPKSSKYYWIGAVFPTITPSSLTNDMQYIACEMIGDSSNVYRYTGITVNLSQFGGFLDYFGLRNNHYHPNEIIAEYMSKYLVGDELTNKGYDLFKTFMKVFIWPKYQEET
jgi:hypothetical protein